MEIKKGRKRVLFLIFNLKQGGGAERVLTDQMNGLDKDIFDYSLCVLNKDVDNVLLEEIKIPKSNKKILNFKSLFDASSWFEIIKWLRDNRFDVVYSHLFFANFVGRIAGTIAGIEKIISTEHNVYLDRGFIERFANKTLSYFSYKIVAVSESVKQYLVDFEGVKENKIKVIYNGIDLKKYNFDQLDRETKRTELGLLKDDWVVVSVGQVSVQKNYDLLIDVAGEVNKIKENKTHFLIVGGDPSGLVKGLMEKSKQLDLLGVVNFLGLRGDVPALLSAADVLIMTSSWEGFGLALVEGMASGKPVIVNDISTLREIVGENNDFGLVGKNKEEFADFLIKLRKDKSFYEKYKNLSLMRSKNFSVENNIKQLTALFLE